MIFEGFHGRWDRKSQAGDPLGAWRLELPVFGHGQLIGRLSVAGERTDDAPMADQFARLARTVAAVELAAGLTLSPPPVPIPARAAVDDGTRPTRPGDGRPFAQRLLLRRRAPADTTGTVFQACPGASPFAPVSPCADRLGGQMVGRPGSGLVGWVESSRPTVFLPSPRWGEGPGVRGERDRTG